MSVVHFDLRIQTLLSIQRALLGEITAQMRFIGVDISPTHIHVIIWHDGPVGDSVGEDFDACVITQMMADLTTGGKNDPSISYEIIRCDLPQRPDVRGTLVYGRNES